MGFVAWAVLLAAIMVVEALGLTLRGHEWPTLSDIVRTGLRPEWSRWLLFAIWLWAGWHFFVHGWTFFLRGPGPREHRHSLGGGKTAAQIVQQVIVPLTAFYAMFAAPLFMAWRARRRGEWPARREPHAGARAAVRAPALFVRRVLLTMVGGYGAFVAAMGVYELIAGNAAAGLFPAVVREGAVLAFAIALPAFAALTAAEILLTRRHSHADPRPNLRP